MHFLKADTNVEVLVGPVVAVGDGFTPVTTLSLSTADEAELIKYNGATALAVTDISANTMAAITGADGYYTLDLSTGNTDTEGFLSIVINDDSLCLPVRLDFMVVNANVYDSLFAAATTDYLQVDTTQVGGTAQTAGDLQALITTVDTVVDGIQTDLSNGTDGLGALKTLIDTVDTVVDAIKVVTDAIPDSGAMTSIAQASALTTVDTVVDAIKAKTDSLTFTVANQVDANAVAVSGTTAPADNLEASAAEIIKGTATSGSNTTVISDISIGVDDQLNGRTIIFEGNTTANLAGQATDITGCTAATNTITFTALAGALSPANTDRFVVI